MDDEPGATLKQSGEEPGSVYMTKTKWRGLGRYMAILF